VYIRISEDPPKVYDTVPAFAHGEWPRLREGNDLTLVGHGMGVGLAVRAAEELAAEGVEADVYDAAYLKPFDEAALAESAARTGRVVTVEDHIEIGGLASIVAEVAGRHRLAVRFRNVGLPDSDLEVGTPADLYEYYGITVSGVVAAGRELTSAAREG
jgi:transketolase